MVDEVVRALAPVFAVRVTEAVGGAAVAVRAHGGQTLIDPERGGLAGS